MAKRTVVSQSDFDQVMRLARSGSRRARPVGWRKSPHGR